MKKTKLVFLLSAIYVGALPLLYVIRYKLIAPVYFFAGDAFYYLDIAHHSAGRPGFSFDGLYMTNGFHPLWEYLLAGLQRIGVVNYSQSASALIVVFYVNLLLLTLAAACFCTAATHYLHRKTLALLIVAPGLFWFITGLISTQYTSTWSYLNGMESALALLCFSVSLLLLSKQELSTRRMVLCSIFLGLGTLARLDDLFIALAIAGLILCRAAPADRLRRLLELSPMLLLLTAYLAYNKLALGIFLPLAAPRRPASLCS